MNREYRVIAQAPSTGVEIQHTSCEVIPAEAGIPTTHRSVYGPATIEQCLQWAAENCKSIKKYNVIALKDSPSGGKKIGCKIVPGDSELPEDSLFESVFEGSGTYLECEEWIAEHCESYAPYRVIAVVVDGANLNSKVVPADQEYDTATYKSVYGPNTLENCNTWSKDNSDPRTAYRVVALKYQKDNRTQYYGVQPIKVDDNFPAIYRSVHGPDALDKCNEWIRNNSTYEWDDLTIGPKWIRFLLTNWLVAFLSIMMPTVLLAVLWVTQWNTFDSFYFTVSFGFAFAAALYTLWPAKVSPTVRYLFENGRFKEKSGKENKLTSAKFILDLHAELSHPVRTPWFWITVIVGASILLVFNVLHERGSLHDLLTSTGYAFDIVGTLHWLIIPLFIWIPLGAFGISSLSTVSKFINKLIQNFEIDVAPWHPDKSGGFAELAELIFLMIVPILVAMFLLGFYSIFGAAWLPQEVEDKSNCETSSHTTVVVTEYADGSVDTTTRTLSNELCPSSATTESGDETSGGVEQGNSTILATLDMTSAEAIVSFTTIGVFMILGLIIAFFGIPMWNIHLKMRKEKGSYENKFGLEADRLQEFIESKQLPGKAEGLPSTKIPDEVSEAQERLDNLEAKIAAYPTWPVPIRISAIVLTSNIPALLGLILNLDTISESILKKLLGAE